MPANRLIMQLAKELFPHFFPLPSHFQTANAFIVDSIGGIERPFSCLNSWLKLGAVYWG